MRRITLVSLLASLLLLLTACGNPVAVKLHENGSGFNATVTGKTKQKWVYWQIGDQTHSVKVTDGTFEVDIPYKAKEYRVTFADNEQLNNPTYLQGPAATPITKWSTFIARYNPLARQKNLGVFDAKAIEGIRSDQIDDHNVISINASDGQILGISVKSLDAKNNLVFKNYLESFTASLGTDNKQVTTLVKQSFNRPNKLLQLTTKKIRYSIITTTNQKHKMTQLAITHVE
ncbi:hypothetical protein [Latilactobacillus sakei]|uniref:hypothetical protein n=1 Tax=Latilactobacillus sakei TaxID=1599 RepID=UPI0020C81A1E|nr:hypothetical protein [Latilactobacillus sakei]MCP8851178.1 hypothetical protein [Latilactobacillus sakei]